MGAPCNALKSLAEGHEDADLFVRDSLPEFCAFGFLRMQVCNCPLLFFFAPWRLCARILLRSSLVLCRKVRRDAPYFAGCAGRQWNPQELRKGRLSF